MNPKLVGILLIVLVATAGAAAEMPKPAQTGAWKSPVLDKDLPTALYVPADDAPLKSRHGRPGILYLLNLAGERISAEADGPIIADFLQEGFLVLTIDYGKHDKAVAPFINHDLRVMRAHIPPDRRRQRPGLFDPQRVQENAVYILPEGYRMARNILYWPADAQPGGALFHLDIRYPSKPKTPAPALIQNPVDNGNRMGNAVKYTYNEVLVEAAMTRGYAAVQVDNPLKHYRGVDPMPDVAVKLKAAVRTVRANAKRFHLSGKVALMGFSRGSGQAGLAGLSAGMAELEKGPHLNQSSRPDALLLHAGRTDHLFLLEDFPSLGKKYLGPFGDPVKNKKKWDEHSAITYVTKDDPPTFLSVGEKDSYRVNQIARLADALKKTGVEHHHAVTPGMGHMVTDNLKVLHEIFSFLDKHLKAAPRR